MSQRFEVFAAEVQEAKRNARANTIISEGTTIVEVEQGNMSRVVVTATVTRSSMFPAILGGSVIVAVHFPWERVYALSADHGILMWDYAVEKFRKPGGARMNGGDMYGVAWAVACATGRELYGIPGGDK